MMRHYSFPFLIVIFILLLAGEAQGGDWPMFKHDAAHSGVADETVEPPLKLLWQYGTNFDISGHPTVSGGIVYFGLCDGNVYALDATTGAFKWKYQAGLHGDVSSPAVSGGMVYIGSENVYALDASTGAFKWKYTTAGAVSSPTISNGFVYVGSADNNVYALDATTGALKWKYTTGGTVIYSSPAVSGGMVYVGSWDSNVYALDSATGALKWKYKTGLGVQASPAVSGGVVYVGSADGNMYALDALTGTLIWNGKTGIVVRSSASVSGGIVYVGLENMYALSASSGTSLWNFKARSSVSSSPAISGRIVYATVDGNLHAFDASTGVSKWVSGGSSSPVVANGKVYVDTGRSVIAFEPETKKGVAAIEQGLGSIDLIGKQFDWVPSAIFSFFIIIILGIGTTKLFQIKSEGIIGTFYTVGSGFIILFLWRWLVNIYSILISSIVIISILLVVVFLRWYLSARRKNRQHIEKKKLEILDMISEVTEEGL